ncbi:glycosyltransferase family 2 protein [Baekduia sp. Peel2402]|uniref:glycosyltransferase family 2 protein n=1 Tax=Baekduia sp. Peel2402 TaxID=3458296 RepID=UPI00403EE833
MSELLPGLTVVLPAHDEAGNILGAIDDATAAAERFAVRHEIVVVDDGSTDSTAPLVERLDRSDVVLVRHGENRGYGAALRSGLAAARMPWILITDADHQFDLQQLGHLASAAHDADLVLGWRIARQDPLARRAAGWTWNRLVTLTLGLRVLDVDCAFKLVRRRVVQDLDLRSDGAAISAELVLRGREAGAPAKTSLG